jgi:hypothetical protein
MDENGCVEKFVVFWDNGSQSYCSTSDLVDPSSLGAETWNESELNEYLHDAKTAQHWHSRSDSKSCGAAQGIQQGEAYNNLLALCDAIDERLLWGSSSASGAAAANQPGRPPLPLQATVYSHDAIGLHKNALRTKPVRLCGEDPLARTRGWLACVRVCVLARVFASALRRNVVLGARCEYRSTVIVVSSSAAPRDHEPSSTPPLLCSLLSLSWSSFFVPPYSSSTATGIRRDRTQARSGPRGYHTALQVRAP